MTGFAAHGGRAKDVITMAGMGPAPKPPDERRRRNATVAMTKLPAAGYSGPVPSWPLPPNLALTVALEAAQGVVDALQAKQENKKLTAAESRKLNAALEKVVFGSRAIELTTEAEGVLWAQLWRTPQAVAWALLGYTREVAAYVRFKVLAEQGDLDAARESRQISDRLGLSPLALLRLRWEIVAPADATADPSPQSQARTKTRKQRFRVVDPDETTGAD